MEEQTVTLENYVVRISDDGKELKVLVHRRVDGKEQRPLGYMLGHNALVFPAKK